MRGELAQHRYQLQLRGCVIGHEARIDGQAEKPSMRSCYKQSVQWEEQRRSFKGSVVDGDILSSFGCQRLGTGTNRIHRHKETQTHTHTNMDQRVCIIKHHNAASMVLEWCMSA